MFKLSQRQADILLMTSLVLTCGSIGIAVLAFILSAIGELHVGWFATPLPLFGMTMFGMVILSFTIADIRSGINQWIRYGMALVWTTFFGLTLYSDLFLAD